MFCFLSLIYWLFQGITFIAISICVLLVAALKVLTLYLIYLKIWFFIKKSKSKKLIKIGIFHPYCDAGGGGERVLWTLIQALQTEYDNVEIYIYTGDLGSPPEAILDKVESRFNIKLEKTVNFLYLHKRCFVEAEQYPCFTLILQSLGSLVLGFEALKMLQPDIFIDTMGYAFNYPLFKWIGGSKIACYTHYPTISTDMLRQVYRRVVVHNNRRVIARNPFLTGAKIIYYKLFAAIYGFVGRKADIVMVNSSWTEDHINSIWKCPLKTYRIYPPCDIEELSNLEMTAEVDRHTNIIPIISVGQFRPEKNHPLILRALYELRSIVNESTWEKIKLILVGSCRNSEDETRVQDMQDLVRHLSLEDNVEFRINISYSELMKELQNASIGLHAMWNEHFGICVVECMAAGLITIAHASGGPRADIIETQEGSQTGFLANEAEEYAKIMDYIISMTPNQRNTIRQAARASVQRFSVDNFKREILRTLEPFLKV